MGENKGIKCTWIMRIIIHLTLERKLRFSDGLMASGNLYFGIGVEENYVWMGGKIPIRPIFMYWQYESIKKYWRLSHLQMV